MSLRETTLSDFQTTQTEPTVEPSTADLDNDEETSTGLEVPEWATNNDWSTNHECDHCGASVSGRYHEHHRDENGVLRRCPECTSQTDMKKGAGCVDDYQHRNAAAVDDSPADSLFGSADTSDLPSYMTPGGAD
jgi:hypothetical protein